MLPQSLSYPSKKEFVVYDHRFNQHVSPTQSGQLAAPSGPGEAGASLDALALPAQCVDKNAHPGHTDEDLLQH